jgi:hypothetical protein
MERALKSPAAPDRQRRRAREFDVAAIARRYVEVILAGARATQPSLSRAAE